MSIAQAFRNFFSFLAGSSSQAQACGHLQPIKVLEDNPVAAKRRHLETLRQGRASSYPAAVEPPSDEDDFPPTRICLG